MVQNGVPFDVQKFPGQTPQKTGLSRKNVTLSIVCGDLKVEVSIKSQ